MGATTPFTQARWRWRWAWASRTSPKAPPYRCSCVAVFKGFAGAAVVEDGLAVGALSGLVEPVFGILVVLVASSIQPIMPWLLAFAAGSMMYVVVEELIPEAHLGEHSNVGTLSVMAGFLVMMVLDVALG